MFVFLVLIKIAACWFPFSHQYWSCLLEKGDVQSCFYQNKDVHLTSTTLGGSSPDAVKDLGLHNLNYALFQYFYALDEYKNETDVFSPTSFSLGFIHHLVEDEIGHRGKEGFINESEDFKLCVSVDSYHYYEESFDLKHTFPAKYFSQEATDFVYDTQLAYSKKYPSKHKPSTMKSLLESILQLEAIITGEKEIVKFFKLDYKNDMNTLSNCGTQSWESTLGELKLSYIWMQDVAEEISSWIKQSKDIQLIESNINNKVQSLFQSHNNTICV